MLGETKTLKKQVNRALILKTIRDEKAISRIEVAQKLGLHKSTISTIVSDLLNTGIVREISLQDNGSGVGRKRIYMEINPSFGSVLGIEFNHLEPKAVLTDLNGTALLETEIPGTKGIDNPRDFFKHIISYIRGAVKKRTPPLLGIGIGISGCVNPFSGDVIDSASFSMSNYPLLLMLEGAVDAPMAVENDANCCAWGELVRQGASGPNNFFFIYPKLMNERKGNPRRRLGLGLGIVINRTLYYGEDFLSGEFVGTGWKKGDREQISFLNKRSGKGRDLNDAFPDIIEELFLNLSVAVSLFNPGCIYVGGIFAERFDEVVKVLSTRLSDSYMGQDENIRLVKRAVFSGFDVARGAAVMFIERLFEIPGYKKMSHLTSLHWDTVLSNTI